MEMKDNSKEGLSSFDENKNQTMETKEICHVVASFKSYTCCLQWLSLLSRHTETKQRSLREKKKSSKLQTVGWFLLIPTHPAVKKKKKKLFLMLVYSSGGNKDRLLSLRIKTWFNL